MTNMIMGTLLAGGYLVVFWMFGTLIPEKFQSGKFPVMCITGFLLYYTLFEIVAFPMKYLCCSLKDGEFWQTVSGQYRAVRKRIYPCLFCCWQQ